MTSAENAGSTGSTDSGLLERAKDREPNAWRQLVELYGPLVYGWCRRARLQSADSADVLQAVFAAVAAGVVTFENRGAGTFRAWLRRVTAHKICDLLRRMEHDPQAVGGSSATSRLAELPSPHEVLPDEPAPLNTRAAVVQAAIEQLRGEVQGHTWQAFWRTTIEEQTTADVAAALGMTTGAVYQARSRTLSRLRAIVRALDGRNASS